jgi:protein ImuA
LIRMNQTALSAAFRGDAFRPAASHGAQALQWLLGACWDVLHGEIFADPDEAGGVGMALALACERLRHLASNGAGQPLKGVLWVQDRGALRLGGRPYYHGLPEDLRDRVIHVSAPRPEDALFALEEGLRCRDLAFVIGEIAGNPKAFDFTASRRLSLTAEKYGVPLYLVRLGAERDLSSARMRWSVRSARSLAGRWNDAVPGPASWQAELFRARGHLVGEWILRDEGFTILVERVGGAGSSHDAIHPSPHSGDLAGTVGG